jgi:hypothetical protein
MDSPTKGYGIRVALSEENTLHTVRHLVARRYAGLVWMTIVAPRVGGNRHVDDSR